MSYTVPVAFSEKQFTVSEVLELGQGMPEAEMLVRCEAVPVLEGDTPEILQRRVMEQCEWQLLPQAVALFCQDKIQITGNKTRILD